MEVRHSIKDDQWHIFNKIGMYLGSPTNAIYEEYIEVDNKIQKTKISYVPALLKMINEIIDNSVDVLAKLVNGKIYVEIKDTKITVKDNGPGIPLHKIKDLNDKDVLIPYSCWGMAKAGSNFNDDEDDATTIGTNGVGSYCCNVHSSTFIGTTCDGENVYEGTWSNHALEYNEEVRKKKYKETKGTSVSFIPELSTFGIIGGIDENHHIMVKQRLLNLSITYPNIKFYFNNKEIKCSRKEFLNMFGENGTLYEDTNYAIGIFPNTDDDFKQFSIINGLNIKSGNHIDYVLDYIIEEIKEKLPKKFEKIKPGDIKNKLQIVMVGNLFPNIQWEGQTKETLKNSNKDVRSYLGEDWKSMLPRVAKNKHIIEEITFLYQAKIDAEEKRDLANADKELKKVKVLKLRKAHKRNKILFLTEGDSALKGIIKALGRADYAFYPCKGVGMNVETNKAGKIATNSEYKDIMSALGFTFSGNNTCLEMNYNYIGIATDADVDGAHIQGLLLAFFKRYCPDLFEHRRILILKTPIKVAKDKKENMIDAFLTEDEYKTFETKNKSKMSTIDIEYKKGLGSMNEKEYTQFFKLRPLNTCLFTIDYKETDFDIMQSWVAEDADYRKEKIQAIIKSGFDINVI